MSEKNSKENCSRSRIVSHLGWLLFFVSLPVLVFALSSQSKARGIVQRDQCIAHLKQIDDAKEKWALEHKMRAGEKPETEDLNSHLKLPFDQLHCAAGGRYTVNAIGTDPQCSIPGHRLD